MPHVISFLDKASVSISVVHAWFGEADADGDEDTDGDGLGTDGDGLGAVQTTSTGILLSAAMPLPSWY
jgi:hypothetical protein